MDRQLLQILGMGLAVVLIIGGVILWQNLRLGGNRQAREALSSANGWTYSENEDGTIWRMRGTLSGMAWVADATRPRHDSPTGVARPNRTRLAAEVPGTAGVLIMPRLPPGPGGAVASAGLKVMLGKAGVLLDRGTPVETDPQFAAVFEVRATDPEAARRLLTDDVKRALLDQAGRYSGAGPAVTWWEGELVVQVGVDLHKAAKVEAFLKLAHTVLEAAASGGAG